MSSLVITKLLTFFHEIDKVNDYTIDRQTDVFSDKDEYMQEDKYIGRRKNN